MNLVELEMKLETLEERGDIPQDVIDLMWRMFEELEDITYNLLEEEY